MLLVHGENISLPWWANCCTYHAEQAFMYMWSCHYYCVMQALTINQNHFFLGRPLCTSLASLASAGCWYHFCCCQVQTFFKKTAYSGSQAFGVRLENIDVQMGLKRYVLHNPTIGTYAPRKFIFFIWGTAGEYLYRQNGNHIHSSGYFLHCSKKIA